MICTCTMNPSLDYYMEFEKPVQPDSVNRSQLEYYEAGGKGINVSIVLNNLQIPTRACGFLGGFTRDFYITLLQKYEYIQPNFTYIDGNTRINVKLTGQEDETDLNAAGPYITSSDMENLMKKMERLDEGDYFVLAGNCPKYLSSDIHTMLENAVKDKVRVCLDTNAEIIRDVLADGPFLITRSQAELEAELGRKLSPEETAAEAEAMCRQGAQHVLVLMDSAKEALLACSQGLFACEVVHQEKAVSTVGTGDSLTAGFLMNYLRTGDPLDSFRFGACCGSATAYSKGLATREKIDSFYEKTEIRQLK